MSAELLAQSVWERFCSYSFYQHALAGGVAIALICSVLSVFVVLKRLAFAGQGISHAAFGGAGVALLLGLFFPAFGSALLRDLTIGAFCVLTALVIGRIARQRHVGEDSAIGICLVAAMALGVMFLDLRAALFKGLAASGQLAERAVANAPPFHDLLFGNILSISAAEAWTTWVVALVLLAGVGAVFKELVFFSCDEDAARVFGVRTNVIYYGLLAVLGATIVLAMRLLGVILASALLILPGVSALLWSRRLGRVMGLSVVFGVGSVGVGLFGTMWLSDAALDWPAGSGPTHIDLPPGPVIVLALCVLFAASWLASAVVGVRRRRS